MQIHGKMVGTIRYRNIRIREFPPLLSSDFRLAPAAEGWEPSKAPAPFDGETIRRAGDSDEHGVRIRKGQLMSKPFPVEPFAFYRLRFLAQAAEKPLCAAVFLDKEGKEIVADDHDSIDSSTDWQPYSLCFRGHADAAQARIRLQANAGPLAVKNLRVEKITADDAAAWAAGLAAQCPVVPFEPASDRWQFLTKTMQRLASGGPLRIVMSGAIAPREVYEPAYFKAKPAAAALDDMEQFSARMKRMCREERAEFFDIRRVWDDYMLRSYKPYDHFARDAIHGNSRGKQIVARMLGRYFEPKDAAR